MICDICKAQFEARPDKRYCSGRCKRTGERKRVADRRWAEFIRLNPEFADLKTYDTSELKSLDGVSLKPLDTSALKEFELEDFMKPQEIKRQGEWKASLPTMEEVMDEWEKKGEKNARREGRRKVDYSPSIVLKPLPHFADDFF